MKIFCFVIQTCAEIPADPARNLVIRPFPVHSACAAFLSVMFLFLPINYRILAPYVMKRRKEGGIPETKRVSGLQETVLLIYRYSMVSEHLHPRTLNVIIEGSTGDIRKKKIHAKAQY